MNVGQWWVRRWARTSGAKGGRLLYLDQEGEVHDLGVFTRDQLRSLAWGVDVGYRVVRERSERIRLARVRVIAHRLEQGARRLPKGSSSPENT